VQDSTVKARGDLIGEVAFLFRLRHVQSAHIGKATATLFLLSSDDYQHVCASYVDDAAKVVEELIHTVESGSSAGRSQASGTSMASNALRTSQLAQQRVSEAVQRHTEQYAVAFIDATAKNDVRAVTGNLATGQIDVDETSDYDQRTALHLAASKGHLDLVRLLLERHGASHAVRDRYGGTPLDDAIRHGHVDVVHLLQSLSKRHIEPTVVYVERLIQAAADDDAATVGLLVSSGLDPNCSDYDHRTALHLSVCRGSRAVLELLLSLPQVQLAPVDRMGHTPLWDAIRTGNADFARMLRAAGAVVQPDITLQLCQAAAQNDVRFFESLREVELAVLMRVRAVCTSDT